MPRASGSIRFPAHHLLVTLDSSAAVLLATSLTASAGISCNKFLAKIASDYRKPNGQFAILPDEAEAFVAALPIAKFRGVGPKTGGDKTEAVDRS